MGGGRNCENGVRLKVECSWNVMAHGDAREGKWRGNWWMEWVASTLHTTSEHGVYSITTADAHTSAASSRLNWRPPAGLNGLVRFAERRNLVSARVPSHFKRSLRTVRSVPSIAVRRGQPTCKCTNSGWKTRTKIGNVGAFLLGGEGGLLWWNGRTRER